MNPRCEFCSAPLPGGAGRLKSCPKCKAFIFATGMDSKEVNLHILSGTGSATAGFSLDRLQSLTVKQLEPKDFLTVEVFRCPLCMHGIVLGNFADVEFDGTAYHLLLPRKNTADIRCAHCNRVNRVLTPAGEPLRVSLKAPKKDSFEYQVDQFLQQPPPQPAVRTGGCLGLLLPLSFFR